jgi:type II secretory pathway pseudopilin PulG
MVSLLLSMTRFGASPPRKLLRAAFTFTEVLMGISILGLTAGAVLYGLNQLNYYASVNRLYTAAQTLAQNQIDLILTKGPFDPASGKYPSPNILGTTSPYNYYTDPTTGAITVAATTATPSPTGLPAVTIYKDPMNTNSATNKVVTGTIFTSVKDTGVTVPVTTGGSTTTKNLYLKQATVTVSYVFRRRTYNVVMETMRTADQ